MKLCRAGNAGVETLAAVDERGQLRDLSSLFDASGSEWLAALGDGDLESLELSSLPEIPSETRLGPCIARPGKFIGIGLNYRDHANEVGLPVPEEPTVFLKASSCLCGPTDTIVLPRNALSLDWEVELAVVISRPGRYLNPSEALKHVAGYCVCIDFSDRDFQLKRGGQWTKGKSADTFGPVGPWLVSPQSLAGTWPLALWLDVDGVRKQTGSTANMVFDVPHLISYVSEFMSLEAGDIITTGTPAGVGMGRSPPQYLRSGSRVDCGIHHLGEQHHVVRSEK